MLASDRDHAEARELVVPLGIPCAAELEHGEGLDVLCDRHGIGPQHLVVLGIAGALELLDHHLPPVGLGVQGVVPGEHLELATDDRIVLGGRNLVYGEQPFDFVRLEADGALDTTFADGGYFNGLDAASFAVRADGSVLRMCQYIDRIAWDLDDNLVLAGRISTRLTRARSGNSSRWTTALATSSGMRPEYTMKGMSRPVDLSMASAARERQCTAWPTA